MRIKIISYNILNGLCSENRPFEVDQNRKKALIELLKKENPDILVLCEAACWPVVKQDDMKDYDTLITGLCSANSDEKSSESFRWAPAIFSKFPIDHKNLSKFCKSFLRTSIELGEKKLTLDAVHINPSVSEDDRAEFFRSVIKGQGGPYIISGDFNSLHPKDSYDEEKLIRGYQAFMGDNGEPKVKDIIKAVAMQPFVGSGLIDTHSAHNLHDFTVPTDWRNKNKDSAVRLDYIFCSEDIKVLSSGVIKNEHAEKASDHYPIFAAVEI